MCEKRPFPIPVKKKKTKQKKIRHLKNIQVQKTK